MTRRSRSYRPHRNAFVVDEKRTVTFESVDIIEVAGIDGEPAALAWILHHDYEGAIPTGTPRKGPSLKIGQRPGRRSHLA